MSVLRVATCQFPVDADVAANLRYVTRQVREAARRGARLVHFPECALSGYAGSDFASYDGYDWDALAAATRRVLTVAGQAGVWVVLGSTHRLSGDHKPHNSLYVIDPRGRVVDRYDKRFCAGDEAGTVGDLAHYSPGDHEVVIEVDGVRCGLAICHDYRYPEIHRDYVRRGVHLVLHSFHAAHVPPEQVAAIRAAVGHEHQPLNPGGTYPGITMPAAMTAYAAAGHLWISAPNSSARESLWGSFVVRADGVTVGRLPRGRTGLLVTDVDPEADVYDSTRVWRHRALGGVLHSGTLVDDPRSRDRTGL